MSEITAAHLGGGPEVCFNGLDDNQNSLIDEGCGVAQSEVQFAVAWDEDDVDIDLYVSDPDGQIAVSDGTTNLGLALSADCPRQDKYCHGQNYENAFVEDPELAKGVYHVRVRLEKMPEESSSVVAQLGVRLPGGTSAHKIEFFDEGQEAFLKFEVDQVGEKKARSKGTTKGGHPRKSDR